MSLGGPQMCVCVFVCVSILLLPKSGMIITARKRSLGQGNMFTGVCLSTGGGVPGPGGCLVPGGAWWRSPPEQLLLRAVRNLLECILVLHLKLHFTGSAKTAIWNVVFTLT